MVTAGTYEFVIDGVLSERACAAFPELRALVCEQHATTRFIGVITGHSGLQSILHRIDDMGLVLTGLRQLPG
ncbi:hypothetical protein NOVA_28900 [Nocardia nova]|nr:hypothetical protein [Nocardia nova]